jgi:hypothetical protein
MRKLFSPVKHQFWPITALIFGPWSATAMLSAVARLTAGTAIGAYISAHHNAFKSVLIVVLSLYFVLAFMIWAVGNRRPAKGRRDETEQQQVAGLSIRQIIGWGLVGMLTIPALAAMSAVGNQAYFVETFKYVFHLDPATNPEFIWLISISTVVMIPTMVIWIVWMWHAWSKTDYSQGKAEN